MYHYKLYSGNTDYVVGIALYGVPINVGFSVYGYDAFYPRRLNKAYPLRAVSTDECLGDADSRGYYTYYSVSPCIYDSDYKKIRVKNMCKDVPNCLAK
jgi:hypothetical protein